MGGPELGSGPGSHRYFGWYSNKSRGMRAKAAGDAAQEQQTTQSPSASVARRRWATMIKRVWQVDPLLCPRCGGAMNVVSFIEPTQPDVIDAILTHCRLADEPARAPRKTRRLASFSTSVISSSSRNRVLPSLSGRRTDYHR